MLQRPLEPKQYTSIRLTEHLKIEEIAASIGSVGDALDNAMIESGNGLYKPISARPIIWWNWS